MTLLAAFFGVGFESGVAKILCLMGRFVINSRVVYVDNNKFGCNLISWAS